MRITGRQRQAAIFTQGFGGRRPAIPVAAEALEAAALKKMGRRAAGYVAGGAGLERSMAANRAAFDRWRLLPRQLRDVSARDLSVELFGRRLPLPFLLAPIGVLELAHAGADLAAARAAAAAGIPFVTSSQASRSLEDIAGAGGPRWFQLYCSSRDELTESFIRRAEAAGYEALVVTLDTTQIGWRPRDLATGYLPFLRGRGLANYLSDPVFRDLAFEDRAPGERPPIGPGALPAMLELLRHFPGPMRGPADVKRAILSIRRFIAVYARPDLDWDDLPFLRRCTRLPILLKGILHPEDAARAVAAGMDGIIVSNHGGRQVDGAVAALDALPAVVARVAGQVPVLFDGGLRSGADMLKALALGARALLLGRPYVYGLALGGEAGVRAVIENFAAELDLTMALSGQRDFRSMDADLLQRAG
ncbi:alpha-hydroxy-acid oxidizing protein [Roseomonas sp. USHLN139]|uniref:alpha-hydroxy-acid oxidizing protein n=1 Tax=Roseomonas sp. USHLN139 TaxID=3081298 RepID=UPI003B021F84